MSIDLPKQIRVYATVYNNFKINSGILAKLEQQIEESGQHIRANVFEMEFVLANCLVTLIAFHAGNS